MKDPRLNISSEGDAPCWLPLLLSLSLFPMAGTARASGGAAPFPPVCQEGPFQVYYGTLHAHTNFSDGERSPAEAFVYARDRAGLDFFAVTDHMEQLYYGRAGTEWARLKRLARDVTEDGVFVGIAGYEWGNGYKGPIPYGHCNLFEFESLLDVARTVTLDGFYRELVAGQGGLGKFNHPNYKAWTNNWNDMEYHPDADRKMALIRVEYPDLEEPVFRTALDKGWHLAPVSSQDNHHADWGTKNDFRTGVWATSLTREGILSALLAMRTFSTNDKNASLRLQAGPCWLGSILEPADSDEIELTIELHDADPEEGFALLELFGNHGEVLATLSVERNGDISWHPLVSLPPGGYVYLRATQNDGDHLFSAPIWRNPQ